MTFNYYCCYYFILKSTINRPAEMENLTCSAVYKEEQCVSMPCLCTVVFVITFTVLSFFMIQKSFQKSFSTSIPFLVSHKAPKLTHKETVGLHFITRVLAWNLRHFLLPGNRAIHFKTCFTARISTCTVQTVVGTKVPTAMFAGSKATYCEPSLYIQTFLF